LCSDTRSTSGNASGRALSLFRNGGRRTALGDVNEEAFYVTAGYGVDRFTPEKRLQVVVDPSNV
jgi:hypothetical protein